MPLCCALRACDRPRRECPKQDMSRASARHSAGTAVQHHSPAHGRGIASGSGANQCHAMKQRHTVRGRIRVLSMLGLLLALLGCGSGNDYGGQTGYDYLPRCQLVVRGPRTDREIVSAAYCVGAVSALVGVALLLPPRYRFCFPDDVTAGEAVQVVVAYLESSLSRLHEDFRPLAIAAMRQAWPCR